MRKTEIPVPRRIYHWIDFVSVVALIVSGWYIHMPFPWAPGLMGAMRSVHFVFMYIFGINLFLRIYYGFFGKTGDWEKYLKQEVSLKTIKWALRHYLLFEDCPEKGKCSILQNTAYAIIVILFALQVATGAILYVPENRLFASAAYYFGGLSSVRSIHFFFMWATVCFIIVHHYMAMAEEFDKVKLMFFGSGEENGVDSAKKRPVRKKPALAGAESEE